MTGRLATGASAQGRHLVRVVVATALLVGLLAARDASGPSTARACSCVPWPESLAAYRTDANIRILSGTVVALTGQRGMFSIDRVFKGPVSGPAMAIDGGDAAMCGLGLKLGMRLVMATWTDGNVLQASSCMPSAVLPSPEGDAMLADAEEAYGGVAPPPEAPVEPTAPPQGSPGPVGDDVALPVILGLVLAAVILLFGVLALVARRPRSGA